MGEAGHGCVGHVPDEIDVKAIREKIALSQSEFAKLFGLRRADAGALVAWRAERSGAGVLDGDRQGAGGGAAGAAG